MRTGTSIVTRAVYLAAFLVAFSGLHRVPLLRAAVIYVRVSGDDGNEGSSPTTALRTIRHAAAVASPGDRIVVGPGTYHEGDITPHAFGHIRFSADRRGTKVAQLPGDVVVDASDFGTGFLLAGKIAVVVDGFVVRATTVGIHVKSSSDQAVLSNNIVVSNAEHGIYVQDSKNVVVFNNLVYDNGGSGILVSGNVSGSAGVQIINNTVYNNSERGIFLSGTTIGSPNGLVINNLLQGNKKDPERGGVTGGIGIQVNDVSRRGYLSAGNVSADRFPTGTPRDATDQLVEDVLFADPSPKLGGAAYDQDRFYLSQKAAGQTANSPAVNAGTDLARRLRLWRATTRTDTRYDRGWVDAGYHYDNFARPPRRSRLRFRYAVLYVDPARGEPGNSGASRRAAMPTLADAFAAAQPGHAVLLAAGTYSEGGLRPPLAGPGHRDLLIYGRGQPIIDASGFPVALIISGEGSVTIDGLVLRGASTAAVQIRTGAAARIQRSTIRDNAGDGVQVRSGGSLSLSRSRIAANARLGILVNDSSATITDATVADNGREGIRAKGSRLHVDRTAILANGSKGLSVNDVAGFEVRDSEVAYNQGNAIQLLRTAGAVLNGCIVHGNNGDGIAVFSSASALVWNNLVYDNASTGILIGSASADATIINNTVVGHPDRGLLVGASDLAPPSAGATVRRNIFQGNAKAGLQVNRLSLPGFVGDFNLNADAYGAQTPVGENDVVVDDALFVDRGNGIFYLSQRGVGQALSSPAIDAGDIDASAAGLSMRTTRLDGFPDAGVVDLGFHYPGSASDCGYRRPPSS